MQLTSSSDINYAKKMSKSIFLKLANPILFQINWFACIFSDVEVYLLSTLALLVFHGIVYVKNSFEWQYIVAFSIIGYACDSVLLNLGLVLFTEPFNIGALLGANLSLAPLWILCLWLSFSTCLNHCLRYLQARYVLSAFLVIIGIPFNYYLGANFTDSVLFEPIAILLSLITLYWLVLLLATLKLFHIKNRAMG
jgi:hypothetical protein